LHRTIPTKAFGICIFTGDWLTTRGPTSPCSIKARRNSTCAYPSSHVVRSTGLDASNIGASFDQEITVVAPVWTPGILHDPVLRSSIDSVAYAGHSMAPCLTS
jgi:hypothetical protein